MESDKLSNQEIEQTKRKASTYLILITGGICGSKYHRRKSLIGEIDQKVYLFIRKSR